MRRAFFAGVLLVATGATGLRAQSKPGTEFNPYNLADTIVVTADRLARPRRTTGSSITVITAEQIENSQAAMVLDILRAVPGLNIVRSGGFGQQTSVFMRGSNSEHTLVLIDGAEVNDPSSPNSAANLAHLSVDNIERIEILRGPQSVLYGSDAVGGVIQVFTKRGHGRPRFTLSTEAGSFATHQERLSVRSGSEDVDYSLTISHRRSDGISATVADEGRPEPDGYDNTTLSASFGLRPSDKVEMRFSGRTTEAETDLDQSSGILDDRNYRLHSKERWFSAQLTHRAVNGRWSQRLGAYVSQYHRSAVDSIDSDHPFYSSEASYFGRRVKFDWQHLLHLHPLVQLTLGATTEKELIDYTGNYGGWYTAVRDSSARTRGLYVMNRFELGSSWYGTFGLRSDNHERFGSKTTYRITSAYLMDNFGVKLKASFGTGFKAPALVQLYDPSTGNTELKPETSEGWDIGVEKVFAADHLKLGFTYFHTSFTGLIQYNAVAMTMDNLASASMRGAEIFGEYTAEGVTLRLDYTNTLTRDNTSGDRLPLLRRPRHKVSFTMSGQATDRLTLNFSYDHVGRRIDLYFPDWPQLPARVELGDYTRIDLGAAYRLSSNIGIKGRIENLLDDKYEEVLGFGSIPISGYVGLELSI